MMDTIRVQ